MAGTRTVPTIDGTGTLTQVSVSAIDSSGDIRSWVMNVPTTTTNAEVEDMIAKWQLATNASVFQVRVSSLYAGAKLAGNADDSPRESIFGNIAISAKNASLQQKTLYVFAPIEAMFADGDSVDTTNTIFDNAVDAMVLSLNGGSGGSGTYAAETVTYTERSERNQKEPYIGA